MQKTLTHSELLQVLRDRVNASSQAGVAAELGVSRSMVNELLSGRLYFSERVAGAMGFKRELIFRRVA